jgi:hypothetical protein
MSGGVGESLEWGIRCWQRNLAGGLDGSCADGLRRVKLLVAMRLSCVFVDFMKWWLAFLIDGMG